VWILETEEEEAAEYDGNPHSIRKGETKNEEIESKRGPEPDSPRGLHDQEVEADEWGREEKEGEGIGGEEEAVEAAIVGEITNQPKAEADTAHKRKRSEPAKKEMLAFSGCAHKVPAKPGGQKRKAKPTFEYPPTMWGTWEQEKSAQETEEDEALPEEYGSMDDMYLVSREEKKSTQTKEEYFNQVERFTKQGYMNVSQEREVQEKRGIQEGPWKWADIMHERRFWRAKKC
jgi:hypothetical protein